MGPPLELSTVESFRTEVERGEGPTVVMFTTSWCPFCRRFKPKFLACASDNPELRLAMVYIDDYENPLWDEYRVDVVPTLVVFDGGNAVFRRDGILGAGLGDSDLRAVCDFARSTGPDGSRSPAPVA